VIKEWSHLPNAKHIDWVIKTLKKNPEAWFDAGALSLNLGICAAHRSAEIDLKVRRIRPIWNAALSASWSATRGALCGTIVGETRGYAMSANTALIVWDDSSKLLDKPVEEVEGLVKESNHAAVLMLPAVIVKNKLKEKNSD
jgi:hypothetical protein